MSSAKHLTQKINNSSLVQDNLQKSLKLASLIQAQSYGLSNNANGNNGSGAPAPGTNESAGANGGNSFL